MDSNSVQQDDIPLSSLSLTHVHYNANDPWSLLCAYLSLLPQALIICYVVLIWAHREIEVILMLGGQLFCEAVNFILKRTFKEARPHKMNGKGYGMPSSHAQFAFFFSTYLTLWVLYRNRFLPRYQRLFFSLGLIVLSTSIAHSRIYLHYHTPKQVAVGVVAGSVLGVIWFVVTGMVKVTAGGILWDIMLDNPISKFLLVKDMSTDLMVQQLEWNVWSSERSMRRDSARKARAERMERKSE